MSALITPAELAEHRADAESRMGADNGGSTVTVRRKAGRGPQDETTGVIAAQWSDIYSDQPARLAGTAANSAPYSTTKPGGAKQEQAARVVHFPVTTTGLKNGDLVDITAGENAGTVWKIVSATWQDGATSYRVPVVQVDRPKEWG